MSTRRAGVYSGLDRPARIPKPGKRRQSLMGQLMLNTETGYKRRLSIAALYNLVLGRVFLVLFSRLMAAFDMPVPPRELAVFHQMAILLAMAFGVGYYMVSRDLYGQKGIVVIGAIGKTAVFLLFLYHFVFSGLHPFIFLIGAGDLVFVFLFLKFLAFAGSGTEPEQS